MFKIYISTNNIYIYPNLLPLYCFLKYFINISFKINFINISFKINIFFCFLFLMYLIFLSIDCFTNKKIKIIANNNRSKKEIYKQN